VATSLVEQLTHKRDSKLMLIENLTQQAADEGRDLTEQDMATIEDAQTHVRGWNDQLAKLTVDLDLAEDTQRRLSGLGSAGAVIGSDFQYRSDGQLLWDVLHQGDQQAKQRYHRVYKRAAEHMGTLAANTTPVAGDLGGLVVQSPVGPVINPYRTSMPLASAIGMRDVPASDGFGFSRPQIVDANLATGVGVQALEKGELASKAFNVTTTPVALDTVGGYLNISQQLLTFMPASLQIILDQLRTRLEHAIEGLMFTAMSTGATVVPIGAGATAADILAAIYQAAAAYYGTTNTLPAWLAMGPLGWAHLGGLTDLAGRPMFPTLGAANAPGTASATSFAGSVAGLTPVVTSAITDDSLYVGGPDAVEGYLHRFPVLEAVEPSVLGRQVAVAASVAGYQPTPFVGAIQKLDFA
jgi:HK97 family phage major capsid protein